MENDLTPEQAEKFARLCFADEAKVNGKWYGVSHFALDLGMVWLKPGHGIMSGFVDIANVEEWKGVAE